MTPSYNKLHTEELFKKYQYLVPITLTKAFGNLDTFARSINLEADDLIQLGNIGLWKAILKHNKNKSTLRTYAINYIKWYTMGHINRLSGDVFETNKPRTEENMVNLISFERNLNEEDNDEFTFHDIIPDQNTYLEFDDVIVCKEIFDKLTDKEKTIVNLRIMGYSNREIGKKFGVTHQYISLIIKKVKEKVKKY
ncbi:MAG TPA: sigma-70 family RNA polymerase sigma factor [Bacilli bacterium]